MRALLGLALALKLWMGLDANVRRVRRFWYAILLLPFGEVVYFVAIKLRDFNMRASVPPQPPEPPELMELEREVALSPSFRNRVRLGWALLENGQPERARDCFERALCTHAHAHDKHALFGLGLCRLELREFASAADCLQELVQRSLAYEDYEAAIALAEALFRSGKKSEAFELLQQVIRDSRRIEHQLLLARYQLREREKRSAEETLREALNAFESQPDPERMRNGAVATEARRLLRTLEQSAT